MKFCLSKFSVVSFLLFFSIANAQEQAISPSFSYIAESNTNLSGGEKVGSVYLGNFNLMLEIDSSKLMNISENEVFFNLLGYHGEDPTSYAGDIGTASNIEAGENTVKVFELWTRQKFFAGNWSVLVGLHDLNSEFYVTESSLVFINSAFGIGTEFAASGENGPSVFPTTSIALVNNFTINEKLNFIFGIYDAVSGDTKNPHWTHIKVSSDEGYIYVGELAYSASNYILKFGGWNYSEKFETIRDENKKDTNSGYYILAESSAKSINYFFRYGYASSSINQVDENIAFGANYEGLYKENDIIGFGISINNISDDYIVANDGDNHETTYEVLYQIPINDNFMIQPDYQYIQNPGGNPDLKDANVFIIKVEASF